MSYQMSDYLENKLLNVIFKKDTWSVIDVYAALFTADPTDAGTGPEVVAASYARQKITSGTPTAGMINNSADILFPVSGENWGIITHVALFDAVSGGNMLFYGTLAVPKTITTSDQFKVPQNYLQVTLD